MSDSNLVPEPKATIFDAVNAVIPNSDEAAAVIMNPNLAKQVSNGKLTSGTEFSAAESVNDSCGCGSEHPHDDADVAGGNDAVSDCECKESGTVTVTEVDETVEADGTVEVSETVEVTEPADSASPTEPTDSTEPASQAEPTVDESGDITLVSYSQIGMATAQDVREALHQVIDPELGIDVIDLGLVYGIEIDELGRAIITMTLTTPACPLTDLIEDECASTLAGLVEEFRIDWTWTPRWTVENITPEGRDQLAALGFNLDALPRY